MDGFDIYNAILRTKTKVDTYCMGIAASISAVLFQAGRNRIMADYGVLMYHNPFGDASGEAIDAMKSALCTMVASRCGMSEEQVSAIMNRTTYLLAEDAKRMGLCDSIQGSSEYNKKRMTADISNDAKSVWKEASLILNNIFKTEHNMPEVSLTRICNRLKLVPQANEDAVLEAINAIENRNRELESTLTAQRNQITALETEKTNLTTTVNTLKTEKEAAEKAAKKVNAEALVKAAVNLKTIKNDAETIAKWTDRAIADYDGTKDLLESIPVNQVSNRIKVGEQGNKGGAQVSELDNAVALEMARIQNRLNGRTEVK
jgi:hypothetical protein